MNIQQNIIIICALLILFYFVCILPASTKVKKMLDRNQIKERKALKEWRYRQRYEYHTE